MIPFLHIIRTLNLMDSVTWYGIDSVIFSEHCGAIPYCDEGGALPDVDVLGVGFVPVEADAGDVGTDVEGCCYGGGKSRYR